MYQISSAQFFSETHFLAWKKYPFLILSIIILPILLLDLDPKQDLISKVGRFELQVESSSPLRHKVRLKGVIYSEDGWSKKSFWVVDKTTASLIRDQSKVVVFGEWKEGYFKGELVEIKEAGESFHGIRKKIFRKISERLGGREEGQLFLSLLFGLELPPRVKKQFGQAGLLHLVTVSGFHFTLMSSLLQFFFQNIGRGRKVYILTALSLLGYASILGPLPSVLRALFSSLVALCGKMTSLRQIPLNTLGLAFILTLLVDPSFIHTASFQLSFGITLSILVLYPLLAKIFPSPPLEEVRQKSFFKQVLLVIRTLVEQSLLMQLSVTALALPLSFYWFGSYPLLTMASNLFLAPFFSILIVGFVISTLLGGFLDGLFLSLGGILLSTIEWITSGHGLVLEGEIGGVSLFFLVLALGLTPFLLSIDENKGDLSESTGVFWRP